MANMDILFWNFYHNNNIAFADNFAYYCVWKKIEILLEKQKDEIVNDKHINNENKFGLFTTTTKTKAMESADDSGCLVVQAVTLGSVADREGTLRPGDVIERVNGMVGVSACKMKHLLQTPGELVLLVQYPVKVLDFRTASPCLVLGRIMTGDETDPLGFTIAIHSVKDVVNYMKVQDGEEDEENDDDLNDYDDDDFIFSVDQVYEASLVDRDGVLHSGDRILEVNGQSLNGKNLKEVYSLFDKPKKTKKMMKQKSIETSDDNSDDFKTINDEDYCTVLFIPKAYHGINLAAINQASQKLTDEIEFETIKKNQDFSKNSNNNTPSNKMSTKTSNETETFVAPSRQQHINKQPSSEKSQQISITLTTDNEQQQQPHQHHQQQYFVNKKHGKQQQPSIQEKNNFQTSHQLNKELYHNIKNNSKNHSLPIEKLNYQTNNELSKNNSLTNKMKSNKNRENSFQQMKHFIQKSINTKKLSCTSSQENSSFCFCFSKNIIYEKNSLDMKNTDEKRGLSGKPENNLKMDSSKKGMGEPSRETFIGGYRNNNEYNKKHRTPNNNSEVRQSFITDPSLNSISSDSFFNSREESLDSIKKPIDAKNDQNFYKKKYDRNFNKNNSMQSYKNIRNETPNLKKKNKKNYTNTERKENDIMLDSPYNFLNEAFNPSGNKEKDLAYMDLTYTVVIQKKNMNDRLGIVVGRNMEKNDGGRVVLGFRCDSIAKKTGAIHVGDEILSANKTFLNKIPRDQTETVLEKEFQNNESIALVIRKPPFPVKVKELSKELLSRQLYNQKEKSTKAENNQTTRNTCKESRDNEKQSMLNDRGAATMGTEMNNLVENDSSSSSFKSTIRRNEDTNRDSSVINNESDVWSDNLNMQLGSIGDKKDLEASDGDFDETKTDKKLDKKNLNFDKEVIEKEEQTETQQHFSSNKKRKEKAPLARQESCCSEKLFKKKFSSKDENYDNKNDALGFDNNFRNNSKTNIDKNGKIITNKDTNILINNKTIVAETKLQNSLVKLDVLMKSLTQNESIERDGENLLENIDECDVEKTDLLNIDKIILSKKSTEEDNVTLKNEQVEIDGKSLAQRKNEAKLNFFNNFKDNYGCFDLNKNFNRKNKVLDCDIEKYDFILPTLRYIDSHPSTTTTTDLSNLFDFLDVLSSTSSSKVSTPKKEVPDYSILNTIHEDNKLTDEGTCRKDIKKNFNDVDVETFGKKLQKKQKNQLFYVDEYAKKEVRQKYEKPHLNVNEIDKADNMNDSNNKNATNNEKFLESIETYEAASLLSFKENNTTSKNNRHKKFTKPKNNRNFLVSNKKNRKKKKPFLPQLNNINKAPNNQPQTCQKHKCTCALAYITKHITQASDVVTFTNVQLKINPFNKSSFINPYTNNVRFVNEDSLKAKNDSVTVNELEKTEKTEINKNNQIKITIENEKASSENVINEPNVFAHTVAQNECEIFLKKGAPNLDAKNNANKVLKRDGKNEKEKKNQDFNNFNSLNCLKNSEAIDGSTKNFKDPNNNEAIEILQIVPIKNDDTIDTMLHHIPHKEMPDELTEKNYFTTQNNHIKTSSIENLNETPPEKMKNKINKSHKSFKIRKKFNQNRAYTAKWIKKADRKNFNKNKRKTKKSTKPYKIENQLVTSPVTNSLDDWSKEFERLTICNEEDTSDMSFHSACSSKLNNEDKYKPIEGNDKKMECCVVKKVENGVYDGDDNSSGSSSKFYYSEGEIFGDRKSILNNLSEKSAREYEKISQRIEEIVNSLKLKNPKHLKNLMDNQGFEKRKSQGVKKQTQKKDMAENETKFTQDFASHQAKTSRQCQMKKLQEAPKAPFHMLPSQQSLELMKQQNTTKNNKFCKEVEKSKLKNVKYETKRKENNELEEDAKRSNSEDEAELNLRITEDIKQMVKGMDNIRQPMEVLKIILRRSTQEESWGFGIAKAVEKTGLYVSGVAFDGLSDGVLIPFDWIIQIEGIRSDNLTVNQAVQIIMNSKLSLNLIICRQVNS